MNISDEISLLNDVREEKVKKSPIEIFKTILIWIVIILICREIFTNTKEDAIINAPYYPEPQQMLLTPQEQDQLKIKIKVDNTEAIIKPQVTYKISARVIEKHRILGDRLTELVPYDLGLVWGDLMKDRNYKKLRTHQYQRWVTYRYSAKDKDLLNKIDVAKHLSNNHIIPANKNIFRGIKKLRRYDKVYLEGYLVYCDVAYRKTPLFQYNSSLTRDDTGDHACEVFYVTKIISARGTWQ